MAHVPSPALPRQLGHDLRSLLAAATTNLAYVRSIPGVPEEVVEVAGEVDRELRLAADVIELLANSHEADRLVALDLRALLWLARAGSGRVLVDATLPAFVVRGPYGAILALIESIIGAVEAEVPARLLIDDSRLAITGLHPAKVRVIAESGFDDALELEVAASEEGCLELRRR